MATLPDRTPAKSAARRDQAELVTALCLTVALVLLGQQLRPLLALDEPRYLAVAWEMWRNGDWLVPRLNGVPYHDKGPLLFWLIEIAWTVFGVSESAARIVPAVFAISSVYLTAKLATRLWPDQDGVSGQAALILAGTGLFALFSTLVMFDALLTTCVLIGILGIDAARRGQALSGWCLFGVGIGLGLLAKGPVVLVHLLPAALLAPVWMREPPPRRWAQWYLGCSAGIALGALGVLAWAVPAAAVGGAEYRESIFWTQYVGRVIGSNANVHARPLWFYVALLPALLFPWLWWPPMWRAAWRVLRRRDDSLRLLAVWAGCSSLILSSIAGKQVHYLMPLLPALALVAGRAIASHPSSKGSLLPVFVSTLIGSFLLIGVVWTHPGHPLPATIAAFPVWSGPVFLGLAGCFALTLGGISGVVAVAALCPAVLLLGQLALRSGFDAYDLGDLARSTSNFDRAGIAYIGPYNGELAFQGRLEQPIAVFANGAAATEWIRSHPGGIVVGEPAGETQVLGLLEVFRRPYRNTTLAVWLVPRADCSLPNESRKLDFDREASGLSRAAVAFALAEPLRFDRSGCR